MTEEEFTERLIEYLKINMTSLKGCEIETKRSVLYNIFFDDTGHLCLNLNEKNEPKRGSGQGFEQDIIIFERNDDFIKIATSIIPRVIAEVKYESITTHDIIVYSEKSQLIRKIYPYVRYGLIIGNKNSIPGRVLRLGTNFDFILCLKLDDLFEARKIFDKEVNISRQLCDALFKNKKIKLLQRELKMMK
ncbi:hypothetical protein ACFL2X_03105 [Candidatus Latescibacterota bacterium]